MYTSKQSPYKKFHSPGRLGLYRTEQAVRPILRGLRASDGELAIDRRTSFSIPALSGIVNGLDDRGSLEAHFVGIIDNTRDVLTVTVGLPNTDIWDDTLATLRYRSDRYVVSTKIAPLRTAKGFLGERTDDGQSYLVKYSGRASSALHERSHNFLVQYLVDLTTVAHAWMVPLRLKGRGAVRL